MHHPIKSAIAGFAIFTRMAIAAQSPAAAQAVTLPAACSSGDQLVRNGIPYVRQCLHYRADGQCARFNVFKCGGGGIGNGR